MDPARRKALRALKADRSRMDQLTASTVQHMRDARAAGLPLSAIAEALGITHQTVTNRLAKADAQDQEDPR